MAGYTYAETIRDLTFKIQQDLGMRVDKLCYIRNQPALFIAEEFYELRNTIDIETEELLVRFRKAKLGDNADEVVKTEKTRREFIRILQELEKRCLSQLPATNPVSSEEAYAHFRQKIAQLKGESVYHLKQACAELILELIEENYELEKRCFGEQTILYITSSEKRHLVYIGEHRLKAHEIRCFQGPKLNELKNIMKTLLACSIVESLSTPVFITKNKMVVRRLEYFLRLAAASSSPKFIYMGEDKEKYTGYSAENANVEREFVSYRFPSHRRAFEFGQVGGISADQDLPGLLSAEKTSIQVSSSKLESLDFLGSSQSAHSLHTLILKDILLDSFDGVRISNCVNLRKLTLEPYESGASFSNLGFLRPLGKLESLSMTMRDFHMDLRPLQGLSFLKDLRFVSAPKTNGDLTYRLFNAEIVFPVLYEIPNLHKLTLVAFSIDGIDEQSFDHFEKLQSVVFLETKMDRIDSRVLDKINYMFMGRFGIHVRTHYSSPALSIDQERVETIRI